MHINDNELFILYPNPAKDIVTLELNGDKTQKINFDWKKHIIEDNDFKFILNLTSQKYNVRDLWEHINLGNTNKIFQKELAPHDVIAIKLTKVKK